MTDALREAAQQALRIFDWLERRAIYGDAEMAAVHAKLRAALAAPPAAPPVPEGWSISPLGDGTVIVSHNAKGGYAAHPAHDQIASAVLAAFATDVLAAAQPVPATGAQPAPAPEVAGEPVTLADVLDALNLFNRPKPNEDDGPWEGGHFIRVDHLPDFINVIAAAWFAPTQPALAQPAPAAVPADIQRDAERYRWLRHGDNDERCIRLTSDAQPYMLRNSLLDRCIDECMADDAEAEKHTAAAPQQAPTGGATPTQAGAGAQEPTP